MDDTDIIYARKCKLDSDNAEHYCRKQVPWGFVRATDLIESGTKAVIRTMHGDIETVIVEDMILTISPIE